MSISQPPTIPLSPTQAPLQPVSNPPTLASIATTTMTTTTTTTSTTTSTTDTSYSPATFTEEQLENLLLESNYLSTLKRGIELEYFGLFIQLIDEYMKYVATTLHIHDIHYKKFVVCRGIQSLHHIFNQLLIHTKNIHLVVHHLQKAICLYVEFNGQIKIDSNEFLKLTSNDSIMFLYKKTIFALNQDKRKTTRISPREREMLSELHRYTRQFVDTLLGVMYDDRATFGMKKVVDGATRDDSSVKSYITEYPTLFYVIQCFKYVIVTANTNKPIKLFWLNTVERSDDSDSKNVVEYNGYYDKKQSMILPWVRMYHYITRVNASNTHSTHHTSHSGSHPTSHHIHELIKIFTDTPVLIEPTD